MPVFQDENRVAKVSGGQFLTGISNVDSGAKLEQDFFLPAPNENANWLYYDVALQCYLDSGLVVHRQLPQVDNTADTLASCVITDPNIDALTGRGVNLVSNDQFTDTVQRMAHSQYWFRLFGQALRAGEQVPMPGIKFIGGVAAVPHDANPQNGWNKIVGNYSGVVLWHGYWDFWYTLASPPKKNQTPPQNLAQHIAGDAEVPEGVQAPFSAPDDNSLSSSPVVLQTAIERPRTGR